jgi:L-2-hydroxyglutarate oxidase LhgO
MERIETVVVGAGVVGLAVARRLASAGQEVVVLEAANAIGTGTSSRNSEVVHAGIYYPPGSLKARACVAGRKALYAYCAERGVACKAVGKLIVAADAAQWDKLRATKRQAEANGVDDLRELTAAEAQALEPALACAGALLSPSTGIIDSHGYMLALQGDLEAAGGAVALNAPLLSARVDGDGFTLEVGGAEPTRLGCRRLVNAAGLEAWAVARALTRADQPGVAAPVPPQRYAKGNYFSLSGVRAPFSRLIYPVPEDGGLGVHLTLDLGGQARFGPDVEWLAEDLRDSRGLDYRVDPARGDKFYAAIRSYWPDLPDGALAPAYSGVRPKLSGPGEAAADFMIAGPQDHGVAGLVQLFGIESPGLTASLALADEVFARAAG